MSRSSNARFRLPRQTPLPLIGALLFSLLCAAGADARNCPLQKGQDYAFESQGQDVDVYYWKYLKTTQKMDASKWAGSAYSDRCKWYADADNSYASFQKVRDQLKSIRAKAQAETDPSKRAQMIQDSLAPHDGFSTDISAVNSKLGQQPYGHHLEILKGTLEKMQRQAHGAAGTKQMQAKGGQLTQSGSLAGANGLKGQGVGALQKSSNKLFDNQKTGVVAAGPGAAGAAAVGAGVGAGALASKTGPDSLKTATPPVAEKEESKGFFASIGDALAKVPLPVWTMLGGALVGGLIGGWKGVLIGGGGGLVVGLGINAIRDMNQTPTQKEIASTQDDLDRVKSKEQDQASDIGAYAQQSNQANASAAQAQDKLKGTNTSIQTTQARLIQDQSGAADPNAPAQDKAMAAQRVSLDNQQLQQLQQTAVSQQADLDKAQAQQKKLADQFPQKAPEMDDYLANKARENSLNGKLASLKDEDAADQKIAKTNSQVSDMRAQSQKKTDEADEIQQRIDRGDYAGKPMREQNQAVQQAAQLRAQADGIDTQADGLDSQNQQLRNEQMKKFGYAASEDDVTQQQAAKQRQTDAAMKQLAVQRSGDLSAPQNADSAAYFQSCEAKPNSACAMGKMGQQLQSPNATPQQQADGKTMASGALEVKRSQDCADRTFWLGHQDYCDASYDFSGLAQAYVRQYRPGQQ